MMDTSREHSEPVRQCSVPEGGRISALTLYNVWARRGETSACVNSLQGRYPRPRLPAGIGGGGPGSAASRSQRRCRPRPRINPLAGTRAGRAPAASTRVFLRRTLAARCHPTQDYQVCSICFLSLWTDRYLSPGALRAEPREPVASPLSSSGGTPKNTHILLQTRPRTATSEGNTPSWPLAKRSPFLDDLFAQQPHLFPPA